MPCKSASAKSKWQMWAILRKGRKGLTYAYKIWRVRGGRCPQAKRAARFGRGVDARALGASGRFGRAPSQNDRPHVGSYTLLWGFKMTSTQHAEKEKGRNKVCRTPLHVLLPRCAHLLAGVATPSSQAGSTAKLTVRALPRDRCRSRRLPCTPMS